MDKFIVLYCLSQRADGIYDYRWSTPDGKRHAIYASMLEELREKEE